MISGQWFRREPQEVLESKEHHGSYYEMYNLTKMQFQIESAPAIAALQSTHSFVINESFWSSPTRTSLPARHPVCYSC
jgi:hypothetical protein